MASLVRAAVPARQSGVGVASCHLCHLAALQLQSLGPIPDSGDSRAPGVAVGGRAARRAYGFAAFLLTPRGDERIIIEATAIAMCFPCVLKTRCALAKPMRRRRACRRRPRSWRLGQVPASLS